MEFPFNYAEFHAPKIYLLNYRGYCCGLGAGLGFLAVAELMKIKLKMNVAACFSSINFIQGESGSIERENNLLTFYCKLERKQKIFYVFVLCDDR